MIVLGIESSCDETGVGIVELHADGTMDILADVVASSMEQHARFGGVVPEIASRAHLEAMPQVMEKALADAGIEKPDAVAATIGPGLAGALLVGASAAKASSRASPASSALASGWSGEIATKDAPISVSGRVV